MKIIWINPSFLDYRVPVYEELNKLCADELYIVYSDIERMTPKRVSVRIKNILKDRALGLEGVKTYTIGKKDSDQSNAFANKFIKISYQPNLLKTVMSIDADVIIVEGFFQWSPAGFFKKIFHRKPLVLSYERTFHTERNAPKWRQFYRKIITKLFCNSAIVNGQLTKEYTEYLGLNSSKIVTGNMAADSLSFKKSIQNLIKQDEKRKWNFNSDNLIFTTVGRLIHRKGIVELLDAWKNFNNDSQLVIAGDGELNNEINEKIKNEKIKNVVLLGAVDYSKIPSLYLASDVFITPTLEDNWSLVVPEAMACGLPIACSKYNGCWPELVHDDINGKVFDPLDETSVTNTLNYFYENKEKLEDMGKKSSEIEEKYNPKYAAQNIYKACEIAIKGN